MSDSCPPEEASAPDARTLARSRPGDTVAATGTPRAAAARRLATAAAGSSELNRLAELAARLLGASSAQVSLVSDVQSVVGGSGVAAPSVGSQGAAADSLCTVTVAAGAPLMVTDATSDTRVSALPPVTSGTVGAYLGVPLVDGGGHTIGALCVFDPAPRSWSRHDVSLLERLAAPVVAELELAALSAEYESDRVVWQLAVDAAGIGAFDWNLVTGELRWDSRLLDLFGLERETFGGSIEDFNATVHPEDLGRVTQALSGAVESCGEYAAEYRVLLPQGQVRWVAARGRALPGPDGTAVRVVGAAFDTTVVQEGEARVARVLEAMPTAFFQVDADWRFSYVNAEGERLLGRERDRLVGGVIWDLFPDAVGSDFESHYRSAVASGEPTAFVAYYPVPLDAWYEVRAWPTPGGLSVYFVDVTARQRAVQQIQRAAERSALLAGIAAELADTLDAEEALNRLAQRIVPAVADWCVATLVEADAAANWRRGVRDVGWWHQDPGLRPLVERYAELRLDAMSDFAFLPRAVSSERPVVLNEGAAAAVSAVLRPGEARDLTLALAPEAAAVVRLRGRERTVGLLTVFRGAERAPFTDADVETLTEVAERVGLALDNARLFAEQRDLAEQLQRSMLTAPPQPDHLEIVVRYEPAAQVAQVGGDWYDAFLQKAGGTVVVIGDVVGHDTAAAAAMGQVRSLLRGIAVHSGEGPAEVLRGVDQVMQTLQVDTTATAVVARLEQTPGEHRQGLTRVRWSNAGHPPPILVTADGAVTPLTGTAHDLLLGLDPGTPREERVVTLERGATLLLYTDGLVERRGEPLDEGLARLQQTLTGLVEEEPTLDGLCDQVLRRMLPERHDDDVALVAVRLHPEDRPLPPEAAPRRVPDGVPPPLT
ncbi:MAG: SpoIIE family protein phosphatase [Nocardioidaceae bacterium]